MKLLSTVLFLLIFQSIQSFAKIIEINKMSEVLPFIDQTAWVVFDIDNTLLSPKQTLGSDQWFEFMVTKTASVEKAIEAWTKVQEKTEVHSIEESTPLLIAELQSKNITVFALTARPDSIKNTTIKQLESIGIHFSEIISIGPNQSKGEALALKLHSSKVKPNRIVFTDDKLKHTKSVETALNSIGIENVEFRYGAADKNVANFDMKIAEIELLYFEEMQILISDEFASFVIENELICRPLTL